MITVTADDIRVLARSIEEDPVLVVREDRLQVVPRAEARAGEEIVYSKAALLAECGDEVTDIEAEVLAGRLSALRPGAESDDVNPADGVTAAEDADGAPDSPQTVG